MVDCADSAAVERIRLALPLLGESLSPEVVPQCVATRARSRLPTPRGGTATAHLRPVDDAVARREMALSPVCLTPLKLPPPTRERRVDRMSTAQRPAPAGVIQRLLEEPHRFGFFQAVRLLERWFASTCNTCATTAM